VCVCVCVCVLLVFMAYLCGQNLITSFYDEMAKNY